MATERLSMRKTKEILRLKWPLRAQSPGDRARTRVRVGDAERRREARARREPQTGPRSRRSARRSWKRELYLEQPPIAGTARPGRTGELALELRKPGVTLQLLHLEYLEQQPDGYRYTQFCAALPAWAEPRRARRCARCTRRATSCSSTTPGRSRSIVDPTTGEVIEVELFVAVLGASNYTYAEATRDAAVPDWIGEPRARAVDVLRRRAARGRARPAQERGDDGVPLRAGDAAHVRGAGAALRDDDPAGAAGAPARQGEGRGRRADRAALDPRAAAQRDLLLARRAQRADRASCSPS